ncbi:unnamed protein product [Closterium sp. NIES-54]
MPPEGPSLFLLSSFQKAAFLQSLSLTLPNVEFQPDGISIYDLKYKTYKKYGMTITGTYVTSPSPLVPAATPDNGKFIFFWDLLKEKQVGSADVAQFPLEGDEGTNALRAVVEGASTKVVTSNGKYIWGVSWMVWNSDMPKDAPDEPSKNLAAGVPEAAGAATAVAWFDQVQDQGAAAAAANAVPAALGDPRPQDIIMRIQAAWEGFSAAIATGDAVSATAIFAPVVILLPPNQPRTMLVTADQKQRFAQDLIDAQVAVSVTVEDVVLVELKATTDPIMAGGSSSLSALVRSSYSTTTQSADGWYSRIPPDPPEPPAPPPPPASPAPPVPPTPPAPPVPRVPPCSVAPHIDNNPVLTLLLPSAFDEYLSEPDYDKGPDIDVPAPAPAPRWGQPEDFTWDESAVSADDDVQDAEEGWRAEGDAGADGGTEADTEAATDAGTAEDVFPEGAPGGDDDDGVEYWSREGHPEKIPIPTYPPRNRKRPHPSSQNHDSHPPSPRHKPNDHKRQAYTAAEKLKWVAQLDVAVSVRALARESGIHRKCLANWKRAANFLKEAHSDRCRMHGRGRASWYRPMEIKVYERLLDWRRKGTAVSVGRLQEWSREFMKILYPLEKWKESQRWSDRFHVAEQCKKFWQFVCDKRRERGIEMTWIINADQMPLWLEMPATTTVDQAGVRSVPIRSAGYQKERVIVMLACTADGMKLRSWVFFKRKTVLKGVFLPGKS